MPLVDGEGNIKTVDMSVNFEDTTLKPGINHFTVNLTIGGQTHTVSFDISTEIPENMKSGIKAESTDVLVAGGTGNVVFNWNTRDDTISLAGVTSNNTNVASIGTTTGIEGNKTTTINALTGGTSTITATLSNGETVSIDLPVYVVDTTKEMQVEVADKKYNVGDKLTSSDVTVKVPLTAPDGSTKYIDVYPSVENKALVMGDNTLTGTVTVGNNNYNINITITIENPSNGLVMSVPEAQAMGFTFASYQDGLEITGFENKMFKSTINVPAQIGDFEVLRIGDNAFKGQSNLKAINLPDSVVELGNNSFEGCTNLINFDSNAKLCKIGSRAFLNCTALRDVIINTSTNLEITPTTDGMVFGAGHYTGNMSITPFLGCTSLQNVTIKGDITNLPPLFTTIVLPSPNSAMSSSHYNKPLEDLDNTTNASYYLNELNFGITWDCNNLKSISKYCFYASGISNIEIPIGISILEESLFRHCTTLSNIKLPSSITKIENNVFRECSKLAKISIPAGVTTIGVNAFSDCSSLTNITLPTNISSIAASMFVNCTSLIEITIPNGVTSIDNYAFSSCEKLKYITLPNTLESISYNVFNRCLSLQFINIPSSVTTIHEKAFTSCPALKNINIDKPAGSISGSAKNWGASSATIKWKK